VAAAGHTQDAGAEAKALGRRPGTQAQEAGAGSKIRTKHARTVRCARGAPLLDAARKDSVSVDLDARDRHDGAGQANRMIR